MSGCTSEPFGLENKQNQLNLHDFLIYNRIKAFPDFNETQPRQNLISWPKIARLNP
jgi:hypothetical protein